MVRAVKERQGLMLLTGEAGTGKTTMVHALSRSLEEDAECVCLSDPILSPEEFIHYLSYSTLRKRTPPRSRAEFLLEFDEFLKDCLQRQKSFLLIVDEAQGLSFELLEEIRLLSSMEAADEKLLNILLVGQQDINRKLSQSGCRPLLQRIGLHHHLRPLDLKGTEEYLITRLQIAGSDDGYKIFPATVIKAIHSHSKGYPRVINTLADDVLLLAYSRGRREITPEIVQECSRSMSLGDTGSRQEEERKGSVQTTEVGPDIPARHWKWAVSVLAVLLAAYAVYQGREEMVGPRIGGIPSPRQEISRVKDEIIALSEAKALEERSPRPAEQIVFRRGKSSTKVVAAKADNAPAKLEQSRVQMEDSAATSTSTVVATVPKGVATESEKPGSQREKTSFRTVTAKEGDTLSELTKDVEGWASESMFESEAERRRSAEETVVVRNEVSEACIVSPYEKAFGAYRKALKRGHQEGVLNPLVFEAYSQLASVQPIDHPSLLRDSVAWRETWNLRRSLIRQIDQSYPRAFGTGEAATLQLELNTILNGLRQGAKEGESTCTNIGRTIVLLQGILKQEPTLYELHFNLGVLHQILGEKGKAEAEYRQVRELNPHISMANLNLGVLYLKEGRVEEAERCFRDLSVLEPAYSGSFYLLGVCQSKRRQDAKAVESLKRAILLEPGFLDSYCELGRVQRRMGGAEEARENFRTVLRDSQANSSVLRKLGCYLLEAGWLVEAVETYSRLLEKNDSHSEDWNNRGVAYLRKGEWKRARKDFLKALEEDPSQPEACNNLGILCIHEKEYKRAKEYLLRALELESVSHTSILNAAVLYGQYLEDTETATKYIRDYMDHGGEFQRSTLQGWLDVTKKAVDTSSS